jgi:hypothetical protein
MGRAMQILYDSSVLSGSNLQGSLAGSSEELIVRLHPLSLDDLNKLWSLFGGKPYKMAVGYQVSSALIDSGREQAGQRVVQKTVNYQIG